MGVFGLERGSWHLKADEEIAQFCSWGGAVDVLPEDDWVTRGRDKVEWQNANPFPSWALYLHRRCVCKPALNKSALIFRVLSILSKLAALCNGRGS